MKILIIIPAYNEDGNIEQIIENLQNNYSQYDYIIINDCSEDDTKKILYNNDADCLNLPINLGIGGAVQAGYIFALENNYDIAVQMDGDGQHNPEYLNTIIEPILNGEADYVIGSRFISKEGFQSSVLRRVGIKLLSKLIYLMCKVTILDVTSGFRAVNKRCIELFANKYAQDYPEPEAIVSSALKGIMIKEVPVVMNERVNGVSSINGFKSIYYMIKVFIAIIITRLTVKGDKK